MSWGTAFLNILLSLPELLALGKEIMTFVNKFKNDELKAFLSKAGQSMAQLNAAKTDEDRQNAAKAIADSIAGLP